MWYRRSIPIKNLTKGVTFITTGKESTFFPSTWTPQNIVDAINETFNNECSTVQKERKIIL